MGERRALSMVLKCTSDLSMVLKPALPRAVNALHRSSICGKTGKWSWLKTRLKKPPTHQGSKLKKKKKKKKERKKKERNKKRKRNLKRQANKSQHVDL